MTWQTESKTIPAAGTRVLEVLPNQLQQQGPSSVEGAQVLPFEEVSGPGYAKRSLPQFVALQEMLTLLQLKGFSQASLSPQWAQH